MRTAKQLGAYIAPGGYLVNGPGIPRATKEDRENARRALDAKMAESVYPEDIIRGKFEARLAAALGLPIYPAAEAKNLDDLLEIVEYRTFLCAQEDEPTA